MDDSDLPHVSGLTWTAIRRGRQFYAEGYVPGRGKVLMHRYLLGLTDPRTRTDHENGDGLDNQRDNIRPATGLENSRGFRHKRSGASSQYRGVCWDKQYLKWRATIKSGPRMKFLGLFESERSAAEAYDAAAIKFFGAFASPNFPVSTNAGGESQQIKPKENSEN